jgi:hypothetical protein
MEICQDGIKIILFYSQCLLERKTLYICVRSIKIFYIPVYI